MVGRSHLLFLAHSNLGYQIYPAIMGDRWFGVLMSGYLEKGNVLQSSFTWMLD